MVVDVNRVVKEKDGNDTNRQIQRDVLHPYAIHYQECSATVHNNNDDDDINYSVRVSFCRSIGRSVVSCRISRTSLAIVGGNHTSTQSNPLIVWAVTNHPLVETAATITIPLQDYVNVMVPYFKDLYQDVHVTNVHGFVRLTIARIIIPSMFVSMCVNVWNTSTTMATWMPPTFSIVNCCMIQRAVVMIRRHPNLAFWRCPFE